MTPHELNIYLRQYQLRKKHEQEENISLAWLGAYWQRVNKLPSLKEVLNKSEPKKQMTDKQMLNMVIQLNKAFGGSVKKS